MRLSFRADIEGLRAVAIILVVAAHAGVPFLKGGFVGVDVFFVLSGFLITGLLLREFEARRRISFAAFYARRLQRLLPAVLLAIVGTAIGAMVLLAPFEQSAQAAAAGAAATWTSNLYFALSRLNYFGPTSDTNLFLHTWSLGVEEQFYLLWPAWMLFLLGAWQWQGRCINNARLRNGLIATAIVSFLLCVLLTYTRPEFGFYLVFSRGWQFALGGLAFLIGNQTGVLRRFAPGGAWLGLALIVGAALIIEGKTPYPGYLALIPSLGTAILLLAGSNGGKLSANAALSIRPLQALGRVSYAWYLWHWPTLLLGWTLLDHNEPWSGAILAVVSLALAVVSYIAVEAPVRKSASLRKRPWLVLGGGILLMCASLLGARAWSIAVDVWARSPGQQRYVNVRDDLPVIYAMGCDEWFHSARVRVCAFGPASAEHTAVLMGDSVAGQWFPAVARTFERPGWRLLVLTKSSCPMVDEPIFYARIGREYTECETWRNAAISFLQTLRPDVVLFSSVPTYDFTVTEWTAGTARVLDSLERTGARIGVIAPAPLLPFDGPACLARRQWRMQVTQLIDSGACVSAAASRNQVTAAIANAVEGHPRVRLLAFDESICPDGVCRAERDGVVVFRDSQHLTASYVATLADAVGTQLNASGLVPRQGRGNQ